MVGFLVRRLLVSLATLAVSSFLVYLLVSTSGDPLEELYFDTSPNRDAKIEARRQLLHLDLSLPERYVMWLRGAVGCVVPGMQCDLGKNIRQQDVTLLTQQAMGSTLRLVLAATVLSIILGITVGVLSSLRQYSGFDYSITFGAFLFFSLPVFWVAVLLKQYLAIGLNDWYREATLGIGVVVVLALLSGLFWGAVVGGRPNRRWLVRGVAALITAAILVGMSSSQWFRFPALGPALIVLLSFGAAIGITYLVAGLKRRGVLYASLAVAAIGSVVQFWATDWLQNPTWASWTNILALGLVTVLVGIGLGMALGGLDRPQAARAAAFTGLASGGFILLDIILRTIPAYSRAVNGRVFATSGSDTPNFRGGFWPHQVDIFTHLLLPTLSIMLISFAAYSRYSRASMLEVLNQDYVRTARAKGLTERTVVMRHAFRNALIPVTTIAALDFGAVIGGAVITETVFGWKGMGSLFIDGLARVDPNPVMAFYMITAVSIVVFNLLADVAYARLDPRIRLQ